MMSQTFGASIVTKEKLYASDVMVPIGQTGKSISLQDLSTISVKDFQQLTGSKMGWANKMMFKSAQKKLKHSINKDGTLNNKKIEKMYKKANGNLTAGFDIGGFALGFFLSLIGVLLAYIIKAQNPGNFRKWAWIGFGVSLVIIIILAIL